VIEAIIFDIGGVLAEDVWEHLLLDEKIGAADFYHLDKQHVRKIGKELWKNFAFRSLGDGESWESLEKDYWTAFIEKSGISAQVNDLIRMTEEHPGHP
jgi:hypothetical protein